MDTRAISYSYFQTGLSMDLLKLLKSIPSVLAVAEVTAKFITQAT